MKNNRKNRKRVKMLTKKDASIMGFIDHDGLFVVPKSVYEYLKKHGEVRFGVSYKATGYHIENLDGQEIFCPHGLEIDAVSIISK